MTPKELREELSKRGVDDAGDFEFILTTLIEYLLKSEDPPMENFFDEELAFAKGFILGTAAMHVQMQAFLKGKIQ